MFTPWNTCHMTGIFHLSEAIPLGRSILHGREVYSAGVFRVSQAVEDQLSHFLIFSIHVQKNKIHGK